MAGALVDGSPITYSQAYKIAIDCALKHPGRGFIKGLPDQSEYDRVMTGLGFGEAKGPMTDDDCRICKNPGKPQKVLDVWESQKQVLERRKYEVNRA